MLLSEYISGLQNLLDVCGDLPCYYSSDDEGNSYQRVNFSGSLYYTESLDYRLENVFGNKEEYDDYCDEEDKVKLIPICVVN